MISAHVRSLLRSSLPESGEKKGRALAVTHFQIMYTLCEIFKSFLLSCSFAVFPFFFVLPFCWKGKKETRKTAPEKFT